MTEQRGLNSHVSLGLRHSKGASLPLPRDGKIWRSSGKGGSSRQAWTAAPILAAELPAMLPIPADARGLAFRSMLDVGNAVRRRSVS